VFQQVQILTYKLFRKIFTFNVSCFWICEVDKLKFHHTDINIIIFDTAEALVAHVPPVLEIHTDWCDRFKLPAVKLCCAIEDGAIVGWLWCLRHQVPPELNHDGPIDTQLPLELPQDMAFLFDAFIHSDFRGKSIYPAMLSHTFEHLQRTNMVYRLLITVDFSNRPAMRAAYRAGFKEVGRSILLRCFQFSYARYPDSALAPVKIGKYTGDCNRKRQQLRIEQNDFPKKADSISI